MKIKAAILLACLMSAFSAYAQEPVADAPTEVATETTEQTTEAAE